MQAPTPGLRLTPEQERLASAGLKALIPVAGHPFLSYTLSALADAGYREVCIVVRPGADPIREYYERQSTSRLRLSFVVQDEPLGTAHALLAAERCVTAPAAAPPGHFLVINGDNHYPAAVLERLRLASGPALAGFSADALSRLGNIPPERIAAFALVTTHADGTLARIVEKPDDATRRALADRALISMTCWRFGPEIFEACRAVAPSARGELELPDAVALAIERGTSFQVIPAAEPVLDLSRREDIATAAAHLRGREVEL